MKTFIVPVLNSETHAEYSDRVSGLAWQFTDSRELLVVDGLVSLEGDKPVGSAFMEVTE